MGVEAVEIGDEREVQEGLIGMARRLHQFLGHGFPQVDVWPAAPARPMMTAGGGMASWGAKASRRSAPAAPSPALPRLRPMGDCRSGTVRRRCGSGAIPAS